MQIISIRFADAEQTGIEIETPERRAFASWPIQTWHRELIDAWLAEGNAILPYVEPPVPVPAEVTSQIYDELDQTHGIDLVDVVEALSPKAARRYRLSNVVRRNDPMVAVLQQQLGWTAAQVDALFQAAAAR